MPTQVTNYQCPSCTGPLHYSSESGKLECEFCGSSYDVAEIEALYAEKNQKAEQASAAEQKKEEQKAEQQAEQRAADPDGEWAFEGDGWTEEGMKAYNCPSCGAELICDETTAATSCPYCGNPTVVPGQFAGGLKPDYIIPFKLDKKAAVQALKKHYKGKKLLPKAFTAGNHIEEIKGIYVPYWLFDGDADADVRFEATRSSSHTEGDYEVTITDHYDVRRAGNVPFIKIPVDGSSKMPDEHMDSIEPFQYEELQPFSMAYLPGYLADKYDVPVKESAPRAEERAKNSAVSAMMADAAIGYETCVPVSEKVEIHRGKVHYALLPVWLLSTKWNNQNFLFAMNGQTGKMVGDLPVSKGKFWAWFGGIAVSLSAISAVVMKLMGIL